MHSDPLANYERQLYSDYEAYLLRSAQSKKSPSKVFRLFEFFTLYILLSGSIFTVLVGALNFSAYSARVVHWINPESIIAITKDIQSVISTSSIEIHASEEESESRLESREIIEEKITNPLGDPVVKRYARGKFLGKGGFAKCYEFTHTATGRKFAAKIIEKASLTRSKAKEKVLNP